MPTASPSRTLARKLQLLDFSGWSSEAVTIHRVRRSRLDVSVGKAKDPADMAGLFVNRSAEDLFCGGFSGDEAAGSDAAGLGGSSVPDGSGSNSSGLRVGPRSTYRSECPGTSRRRSYRSIKLSNCLTW